MSRHYCQGNVKHIVCCVFVCGGDALYKAVRKRPLCPGCKQLKARARSHDVDRKRKLARSDLDVLRTKRRFGSRFYRELDRIEAMLKR